MNTRLLCTLAVLASGLSGMVPTASAGPILADTWYEFSFAGAGAPTAGCSPADPAGAVCTPSTGTATTFADAPAWTITTGAGAFIVVTDAFNVGDAFEILDDGLPIFMTPFVAAGGACGDDPLDCLSNPAASSASFALPADDHAFTIAPLVSVEGLGAAYFCVGSTADSICAGQTGEVPAPPTLGLLAIGLMAAASGLRRRRLPSGDSL